MAQANASFSVKGWEETTWDGKPSHEVEGDKMTHAVVQYAYQGDLEGTSNMQYLMTYGKGRQTTFIGLEQFTGKLAGRSGSFVFQHIGKDENNVVTAEFVIVPGSGTGDLQGIRGKGCVHLAGHQESYPHTFEYEFASF